MEKGNLNLKIGEERFSYTAPSLVVIRENDAVELLATHMLSAKMIAFEITFLNVNINSDLLHSGKYEEVSENYGFIPLNIFYEKNNKFFGYIPLSLESLEQLQAQFFQFQKAITERRDKRWSCRARLHLNMILELAHQLYLDYLDEKTAWYHIKNPNIWVSLILEKIHNDYRTHISLITLSDYVHINKTTVAKEFKKIIGCSVTEYIINYRIQSARYALSTTEIPLKEIAVECGFKRESYLIRQFTAKMGMTPTQYRKQCVAKRKNDF